MAVFLSIRFFLNELVDTFMMTCIVGEELNGIFRSEKSLRSTSFPCFSPPSSPNTKRRNTKKISRPPSRVRNGRIESPAGNQIWKNCARRNRIIHPIGNSGMLWKSIARKLSPAMLQSFINPIGLMITSIEVGSYRQLNHNYSTPLSYQRLLLHITSIRPDQFSSSTTALFS